MYLCKQIQSMERLDGAFLFHTNCADIKVCFVTDEIVRVRVAFDRELAEESYVLATTAWEDRLDGMFGAERTRVQPVTPFALSQPGVMTTLSPLRLSCPVSDTTPFATLMAET